MAPNNTPSPALFFALLVLTGVSLIHAPFAVPFALLLFLPLPFKEWPKALFIIVLTALYTYAIIPPPLPPEIHNQTLKVTDIRPVVTPYSRSTAVHGTLAGHNVSFLLYKQSVPEKTHLHILTADHPKPGILKHVRFTESGFTSLAYLRHTLKKRVNRYIKTHYKNEFARELFKTLSTNNCYSIPLAEHFSRAGLAHLLAVSGFHFSFIAMLVMSRSRKTTWTSLILYTVLFTLFRLYMGPSASVFRAYEMIILTLCSLTFGRRPNPINICSLALIFSLLIDPPQILNVGFQLSFLATFALLLISPSLKRDMPAFLLPTLTPLEKTLHLASRTITTTFRLILAVTLATLPTLLATFHTFPILSLLHNSYYPFLLTFNILLFLLGILIPPVHHFNNTLTSLFLTPILDMPPHPHLILTYALNPLIAIPLTILPFYIAALKKVKSLKIHAKILSSF